MAEHLYRKLVTEGDGYNTMPDGEVVHEAASVGDSFLVRKSPLSAQNGPPRQGRTGTAVGVSPLRAGAYPVEGWIWPSSGPFAAASDRRIRLL